MKRNFSTIKVISILLSICLLVSSNLTAIEVFAYEVSVSSSDDEADDEKEEETMSLSMRVKKQPRGEYSPRLCKQ